MVLCMIWRCFVMLERKPRRVFGSAIGDSGYMKRKNPDFIAAWKYAAEELSKL